MNEALADFRELDGIGPAIEARLHEAGVYTWAALSDVLTALVRVRGVASDALRGLIEQAAGHASTADEATEDEAGHERREAFVLRLALADGDVTRTTVLHVRGEVEQSWAGWSPRRVTGYVEEQIGLRVDADAPAGGSTPDASADDGAPRRADAARRETDDRLRLDAGKILGGRPRIVDLVLEASDDTSDPIGYEATLAARKYGAPADAGWTPLGDQRGEAHPSERAPLHFEPVELPPGLHRLRLDVAVTTPDDESSGPVLTLVE